MNKQKELSVFLVLLFYFMATSLTFIDKFDFINDYDWHLNYDYWEDNSTYVRSNLFWFNLFLLSLSPVFFIRYFNIGKSAFWPAMALTIYWLYLFFRSLIDTGNEQDVVVNDLHIFVYSLLAISGIFVLVKIILLNIQIRKMKQIESLEKFKERALKKFSKLNPEHNQKLLEDLLGNQGKALNLLLAANEADSEEERMELMRLALHETLREKDSIKKLSRRMEMYAQIPPEQ